MKPRHLAIGLSPLLFWIGVQWVSAEPTVRGLSMAGAYMTLARGVEAPSWNPANLAFRDNPKGSFTLLSTVAGAGNTSFNRRHVEAYQGRHWDDADKEAILRLIPDNGLGLGATAEIQAFSFSTGRVAITCEAAADAWVTLDRCLFELLLQGNTLDRDYRFDDTEGRAAGLISLAIAMGFPITVDFADHFGLGVTFRLIRGIGQARLDSISSLFRADLDRGIALDGAFQARSALGGSGFGLDLGVAATSGPWTFGMSFQDLFSSIRWDRDVKRTIGYFKGDSLWVIESKKGEKSTMTEDSVRTESDRPFSETLPGVMRLGASVRRGHLILAVNYKQGFSSGYFTSARPELACGLEWRGLPFLPIRTGVVLGGRTGFGTAAGFGLYVGSFRMDLGLLARDLFFPKTMKGATVGVNFSFFSR